MAVNWRPLGRRYGAQAATLVAAALVVFVPILSQNVFWERQILFIALWSLPAIALNFLVGYTGELAIVQLGVFAVGSYTAAILTTNHGWAFLPSLVAGAVLGGLFGMIIGAPGLRVGGWYLAMTSLFTLLVIPDLLDTNPGGLTGGFSGIAGVPIPAIFGHQLTDEGLEIFCVVAVAVTLYLLHNLSKSSWGGAFALLKRGPAAAQSVGINIYRTKLTIYLLSSTLAGFAGAIFPQIDGTVGPTSFPLSQAILLLAGPVVGGLGELLGPVVGIAVLFLIPVAFSSLAQYSLLIYGLALIAVVLLLPEGVIPAIKSFTHWGYQRVRGRPLPPARRRLVTSKDGSPWSLPDVGRPELLKASDITKSFGSNMALDGVSVECRPGWITAVIGPNGSGKTTLLNIMSGMYKPDAGVVSIGDRTVSRSSPDRIARAGMARTFQTSHIPADQTVTEIIAAGAFHRARASVVSSLLGLPKSRRLRRRLHAEANGTASYLGLGGREWALGGELTVGEMRLAEIGRALMTHSPILLLDEPAAGLVGEEVTALIDLLKDLRRRNYTIVIVEHHMELIMSVADLVVVLDQGHILASGDSLTVSHDKNVVSAYLGTRATQSSEPITIVLAAEPAGSSEIPEHLMRSRPSGTAGS
jgi:branched-chain amino acid transport system permease protein